MALTNLTKGTVVGSEGGSATTNLAQSLTKAWINFNGQTGTFDGGQVRDSFNVASQVDNGTGDFATNFTNAMNNANYAFSGTTTSNNAGAGTRGTNGIMMDNGTDPTTSQITILTAYGSTASSDGAFHDSPRTALIINGDLA
jgi:hypothetical protein